jgi:uncharacterized protein YndB with AHSA1/START domain
MNQTPLYFVERTFTHPVETLWSAWTDAQQLEAWYHPTVLTCVPGTTVSDARVGGIWAAAVDVPDYNMVAYFWGTYSVVDEFKQLEHSMHYSQSAEEFADKDMSGEAHRIVIDFEAAESGATRVRFSQFGVMPAEQVPATKAGMESYFDSLESYLQQ